MPRANFDRFGLGEKNRAPSFYSLQYLIEGEMGSDGALSQTTFVDLVAHYDDLQIHHIQDIGDGNTSWVVVTEGLTTMAPTPTKR